MQLQIFFSLIVRYSIHLLRYVVFHFLASTHRFPKLFVAKAFSKALKYLINKQDVLDEQVGFLTVEVATAVLRNVFLAKKWKLSFKQNETVLQDNLSYRMNLSFRMNLSYRMSL